jgi:hypothetical protein
MKMKCVKGLEQPRQHRHVLHRWDIVGAYMMGPERECTKHEQDVARRNSGGGPTRYWRANRSSDLCLGAKDQSNFLVAGFRRNFPQDSWNLNIVLSGKDND